MDRITALEIFARVAALGSFSAAARALGVSQTMVTKHVAALERRLGVKLVHRTTRRMTLTEAGRRLLDGAERILAEVAEIEASVTADHVEVHGTLRVNVPVSFGVREIAPALPDFAADHPALRTELGLNDRMVDLIDEGWDLAVRIGALTDTSLVARKLAPCTTRVCASPAYLEQRGTPRSIRDLTNHNCLGYTLSNKLGAERWWFGNDGDTPVSVSGNLQANNGAVLLHAAVAGQGVIYQPSYLVCGELRAGRLVALPLDQPTLVLPGVFAVYPADRRPPAKVRAFIDFLLQRFSPHPPWED